MIGEIRIQMWGPAQREDLMDWPMYRHVERQANRLTDMIRRLDVDTAKLVKIDKGGAYAEARKKCLNCLSARECLAWVHASPPSGEAPSFCANFELFEQCMRPPASDYQI